MLNYNLGIEKKSFKKINLNEVVSSIDLRKLKHIDKFTTKFQSEEELKRYLYEKKIIDNEDLNSSISLLYDNEGKITRIPVAYKSHAKYLNPSYICESVKGMSHNIIDLIQIMQHYNHGSATPYNQVSYLIQIDSAIRCLSNASRPSDKIEDALEGLCNSIIYTVDKKSGLKKVNYKGLRDLAFLTYNIHEKDRLINQRNSIENSLIEDSCIKL